MSWKSSPHQYGFVAIALHWLSAIAILALFALGFLAANTVDSTLRASLLRGHAPLGIIVLVLTLLRIGWWFVDRRPRELSGLPGWQSVAERVVRVLLYALVLLMGASGVGLMVLSGAGTILFFGASGPLPDFWRFPPMTAHFAGAIALLALASLHIVAALYHQFYKRDGLLTRIWTTPIETGR